MNRKKFFEGLGFCLSFFILHSTFFILNSAFFILNSAFFISASAHADTFKCGVESANKVAAFEGAAKDGGKVASAVAALKEDDFDEDEERDAAMKTVFDALLGDSAKLADGDKAALRDFLYFTAAGIQPGFKGGWDDFELFPQPDKRLVFVEATKDVAGGTIKSDWKYVDGKCAWHFVIPEGTKATVCVNGMCKPYKPGEYSLVIK